MLKHWCETTFGEFILQQECKIIRQLAVVSSAKSIVVVFDGSNEQLKQTYLELFKKIKAQSSVSFQFIFAQIDDEYLRSQTVQHQSIAPEYLSHLVDSDTGQHLESDSYDWLILSHVLESSLDPKQILRESTRVLADGGRLSVFAFSPLHYLERLLWRKVSKSNPSVKTELSRLRLQDWLQVLNYEITSANAFISPLRSLSEKYRKQQLNKEFVSLSSWSGMVYQLDALKRDLPVTPMRLAAKKQKLPIQLVSSIHNKNSNKLLRKKMNQETLQLKLVPVIISSKDTD